MLHKLTCLLVLLALSTESYAQCSGGSGGGLFSRLAARRSQSSSGGYGGYGSSCGGSQGQVAFIQTLPAQTFGSCGGSQGQSGFVTTLPASAFVSQPITNMSGNSGAVTELANMVAAGCEGAQGGTTVVTKTPAPAPVIYRSTAPRYYCDGNRCIQISMNDIDKCPCTGDDVCICEGNCTCDPSGRRTGFMVDVAVLEQLSTELVHAELIAAINRHQPFSEHNNVVDQATQELLAAINNLNPPTTTVRND